MILDIPDFIMTISLTESAWTDNRRRVLIVDDEPAILFAYRKLIERSGNAVDISDNLSEAVKLISSEKYFAVIADVRLSGSNNTDGLLVLSAIREKQPEAKLILVTGYGNKEIEQTAKKLGVSYYFEKPVLPSAIMTALKSLNSQLLLTGLM